MKLLSGLWWLDQFGGFSLSGLWWLDQLLGGFRSASSFRRVWIWVWPPTVLSVHCRASMYALLPSSNRMDDEQQIAWQQASSRTSYKHVINCLFCWLCCCRVHALYWSAATSNWDSMPKLQRRSNNKPRVESSWWSTRWNVKQVWTANSCQVKRRMLSIVSTGCSRVNVSGSRRTEKTKAN